MIENIVGKWKKKSKNFFIFYFFRKSKTTSIHGLGEIKFDNGDLYQGQTKDGLLHGRGRLTFSNGSIYQGEFKDGK
jgi:hypothetical protein